MKKIHFYKLFLPTTENHKRHNEFEKWFFRTLSVVSIVNNCDTACAKKVAALLYQTSHECLNLDLFYKQWSSDMSINFFVCLFYVILFFIWNTQLSYTWTWKHFIGNGYEPKKYLSLKNRQGACDLWIEDEFLRWKWQHWQSEGIFTRSKKT